MRLIYFCDEDWRVFYSQLVHHFWSGARKPFVITSWLILVSNTLAGMFVLHSMTISYCAKLLLVFSIIWSVFLATETVPAAQGIIREAAIICYWSLSIINYTIGSYLSLQLAPCSDEDSPITVVGRRSIVEAFVTHTLIKSYTLGIMVGLSCQIGYLLEPPAVAFMALQPYAFARKNRRILEQLERSRSSPITSESPTRFAEPRAVSVEVTIRDGQTEGDTVIELQELQRMGRDPQLEFDTVSASSTTVSTLSSPPPSSSSSSKSTVRPVKF